MHTVLVTGASGFIGRNVCVHLRNRQDLTVLTASRDTSETHLQNAVATADTIIHLAGVNRPPSTSEFDRVNVGYTETLAKMLSTSPRPRRLIFTSSIQAGNDSPYGSSKRRAEERLYDLSNNQPVAVTIFRLKNVFGKWCRPNYNSVVATFCHNIGNDLPIEIHNPKASLELIFIDDVVRAIEDDLLAPIEPEKIRHRGQEIPATRVTLEELALTIRKFRRMRENLLIPDLSSRFLHQLYSAYLSYLLPSNAAYSLHVRHDQRGSLAEFIKSPAAGQIFVSRTAPGVTRGNHYHHLKTEKFLVLEGKAVISLRRIDDKQIIEHRVEGRQYQVIDIPPGYTHSITNVGSSDLVTLFWASEEYNPAKPDTIPLCVNHDLAVASAVPKDHAA